MDKKQLLDECKTVKKLLQATLSVTNKRFAIKEKTNNFFDKLIDFLGDVDAEEKEEDKFNQHPRTIDKNMEFLKRRFTKDPKNPEVFSEDEKKSGLELLESVFKGAVEEVFKDANSNSS